MKIFKKINLLVIGLVQSLAAISQSMDLPLNFDNVNIVYTLTDFGGNSSLVGNDPVDSTNKVAIVTKTNSAQTWAGTTMGGSAGFANAVAFNVNRTIITMRVYSPDSGIVVRLKIEDPNDASKSVETDAVTTKANMWHTLTFNFANQATGTAAINYSYTYKKASVFFNFGVSGSTAGNKTYYFDDVVFPPATGPVLTQVNLPVNFDSANVDYTVMDFGGNATTIITDPSNSSNKVAQSVKSNSAELWAGTTMSTTAGFASVIPFSSTNTSIKVKVFSPNSGIQIRLKAEVASDPTKSVETEATTTTSNAWEILTFNFANHVTGTSAINFSNGYNKLSIFFNFGVTGATAGTKTYLWDDVTFVTGSSTTPILPCDFESTTINYGLTDFGGNASSIDSDPVISTNKVCKVVKTNSAQTWAGTTIGGTTGFATAVPFTAGNTKMNMRVYSPATGMPIRVKIEDPNDPTKSVETEVVSTVANAWETMEFNFANQANGTQPINFSYTYKKLSVFFNFGTSGATAGEKIFYCDDIKFGPKQAPPSSGKVNVTFNVDAKNVPMNPGDTLTLNGTFNGWCGACTKMTNIAGTKQWTVTIPLDTNSEYEYKFTIGNWAVQENLNPNLTSCTKTTGTFTNRFLKTGSSDNTLPMVCWESCTSCDNTSGPTKTYVTFRVDLSKNKPSAGDTVTLNGNFNGWCGACTPMVKDAGSDVWSTSVLLDKDSTYEYKYTIGAWKSQETLKQGLPCTKTTSGFTNRVLTVTKLNDTLPVVCWESCTSCQNTAAKARVTFKVNMKNYIDDSLSFKGVTLNGTFNGWCGDCNKMTDLGNNIWSTTLTLDTGIYDFKFAIGNWLDQEQFNVSDPCTRTIGNFTNRYISVNDTNPINIGPYCWSTCDICDVVGVKETTLQNVKVYPNPATTSLTVDFGTTNYNTANVSAYSIVGELVFEKTFTNANEPGKIVLDTHSLKKGVYFLQIQTDDAFNVIKFQIN